MNLRQRLVQFLEPGPAEQKSISRCSDRDRVGWEQFGIPKDSGDGFAYNMEGRLYAATHTPITERTILQLSAAMACVRLISTTIATLPLNIYRSLPDGSRKAQPQYPLYELLHNQPNSEMSATDFWQMIVAILLLRGNVVSEYTKIGDRIVSIDPIPSRYVSWIRQIDGTYIYQISMNGKIRFLTEDQVWHIPAFTTDGRIGLSPICYGANVFGSAMAADVASSSVFENGLAASGFVTMPDNVWLKQEQRESFRKSLQEFSGARNAGGSFVLEGGAKYQQLSMNPEDAQMLETRSFQVEEICRWFGVPPTLIGHGDKSSNWGTGLEQQNQSFLDYSIRPWLTKIEQSIRRSLMSSADKARYFAEFSVEGLLRADSAARANFYSSMVNNGIYTRDECRLKENLDPKGGNADVLTVQSALLPINKLGQTAPKPAAPVDPKPADPNKPPADPPEEPDAVAA